MQDEFRARGTAYLDDSAGLARAKRWLNQSYQELCAAHEWPFLELGDASGAAPLTITDLMHVLAVTDTTGGVRSLVHKDRRNLVRSYGDLTAVGTPTWFYFTNNSVRTYPTSADTIAVHYLKVPTELVNDGDEPIVPDRFQDLIIDGAMRRAYKDSDNFESVPALREIWEVDVGAMIQALTPQDYSRPEQIEVVAGTDW